jgi:hypothetical protein
VGHFARDCAIRRFMTHSNSHTGRAGSKEKPPNTTEPTPKSAPNRGTGCKMQKPSGNPVRDSRDDSACYLSSLQHSVEYQVVKLDALNSAPVMRATVGGSQRIVLIDSVSLNQPGVVQASSVDTVLHPTESLETSCYNWRNFIYSLNGTRYST